MLVRNLLALSISCCLYCAPVYAKEAVQVDEIQVEGLQRISFDTIAADIPLHKGDELTAARSNQVIEQLYQSGYFSDIQLLDDGHGKLVIKVTELPAIGAIDIEGNSEIKSEQLEKVLRQAGIQVGNMLNETTLRQVKQSLQQAYFQMGKYAVRIKAETIPMSRNRVKINLHISEGLSAKVQRITFIGNEAFSSSTLEDQMTVTTPGLFTFLTRKDIYARSKLDQSLGALSKYYMDRGYLDFHINSSVVSLTPNHNDTMISIGVSEGAKYTFSGYDLQGELILPKAKLDDMIKVEKDAVFSRQKVLDSARAITNALGDLGYAFATVNPVPQVDKKARTVKVVFHINPGKKVYVRHIAFSGNTVTNDKVLRQQMRFVEGAEFNQQQVTNSETFIKRAYAFITDVQNDVQSVPETEDQVDVIYSVKERDANTVSANVGFSDLDGFIVGGSLNMPNVFGTGNIFNVSTSLSRPVKTLSFTYTEPFFTMDGVSQSINLYLSNVDNQARDLIDFSTNSVGANLSYSIPITGVDYINVGGGVDYTNMLQPSFNTSATVTQFIAAHGNDFMTYTADLGWTRNTTNKAWFPNKGLKANIGSRVAIPGSTMPWYKVLSSATYYMPIMEDVTFSVGGNADYGNGYDNNGVLPLYGNFYGGGWGSVRGYSAGTLGPKDTIICGNNPNSGCTGTQQGQPLGGNLAVNASFNLYFPVPFTKNDPNFRMGLFADMGNVYDTERLSTIWDDNEQPTAPSFSNLRYSVGISFQWVSPLGPLAFSVAAPLNSKSGDNLQYFQFTMGTTF